MSFRPSHSRKSAYLALAAVLLSGCSRDTSSEPGAATARGNTGAAATSAGQSEVVEQIRVAARAIAEPDASVDFVAAEMKGVIKARTNSQALMYYDGYRVTMTTPRERVTRVTFELTGARPTMQQLTDVFGKPEEVGRGYLYEYFAAATGSTVRILAEPVEKPASPTSLARRVLVEGAPTR